MMLTERKARRKSRDAAAAYLRRATLESLELRTLFSAGLIFGATPQNVFQYPQLRSDTPGSFNYTASTGELDATATLLLLQTSPTSFSFLSGEPNGGTQVSISITNTGNLNAGAGTPNLVVNGTITLNSTVYTGQLLSGNATDFGYSSDGSAFDFRFHITGGSLATDPAFVNEDLGLHIDRADLSTGEILPSTLPAGFSSSFNGLSKIVMGPVPASGGPPIAISTVAAGPVVIGSGVKLMDTATLAGGTSPTGNITFTLKDSNNTVVDTETVTVTGDGNYTTPAGFLPTAAGTYTWSATYSGDSLNSSVTDNGQNETEVVSPATPAINTVAGALVTIGSGQALTDTATLSSGYTPTGTITFTLTGPGNTVVDTEQVGVNGNGDYSTPTGFVPTVTGTYVWSASYSGDGNNVTATDNGQNESEVVAPATPALNTVPGAAVVVGSGVALTDTATLSGGFNPTGSITFTLLAPDGSTVVDTETVGVSGNGIYSTPLGYVPTAVGTYQWVASYSGDVNNNPANGKLGDEPETVNKASPSIVTSASFSASAVVGQAIPQDSAILSGGYQESGTITFTLIAPDGSTADQETVTPSGDGTYSTSKVNIATQVGTYTWHASYAGDTLNNGAVDQGGAAEQLKTVPTTPSLVTTAFVTTTTSGSNCTNNWFDCSSYKNCGSYTIGCGGYTIDCSQNAYNWCGTGGTGGSGGTNCNTGGSWGWGGSWGGNWSGSWGGNWCSGGSGGSGGSGNVTIATSHDVATLSGGYNETGTITFTLTDQNGNVVDTEQVAVNGNGNYTTSNVSITNPSGTYTWSAVYSGDTLNASAHDQGGVDEQFSFNNGGTISGYKFQDATGNGLSGDDTGLGNVTITLYKDVNGNGVLDTSKDTVVATTVTAADGSYAFTGLAAGKYIVTEANPSGYLETGPASYAITLASNGSSTGNNFDDFQLCNCTISCVSYQVVHTDSCGCTTVKTVSDISGQLQQGDVVKVTFTIPQPETISFVSYTAPDSYFNANDASQQKIFDLDSKTYTQAGTYSLTVVVPNCDYQVDLVCGFAIDHFGPAGSNIFYTPQGRLFDSANGGNTSKCPPVATCNGSGTISGCVWGDKNNDGKKGSGECGVSGVKVTCYGTTSTGASLICTTTTDANGNYSFCNLPVGTYKVIEHDLDGFCNGKTVAGNCGGSTNTDVCTNICLTTGKCASGYNFGELPSSSICGTVYNDSNKNGSCGSSECGISGVKITLTGTDCYGKSVCVTTYTDANGCYSFDNLCAGKYTLTETQPSGYTSTRNSIGCDGGSLSGDSICSIALNWGSAGTNYNFGDCASYSWGGWWW